MTQEGAIPPDLLEQIDQRIDRKLAELARSGMLRNASISDGGLTIKGGFLKLLSKIVGGVTSFYAGPYGAVLGDGNTQQVLFVRRADGSIALTLWDAAPGIDGTLNQALAWWDRSGNIVLADDTDSGQGLARPWVPFAAYPTDSANWPSTTSTTFVTKHRARGAKQQAKLYVETWVNAPAAGAVAEVQVLVNGAVWGTAQQSTPGFVTGLNFGPLPVAGAHMSTLSIDIQARLASGTGAVEVGLGRIEGRQT